MIAYGNNIYRTLDQKFFIGDKQIGKVYKGTELIYPENKIVTTDEGEKEESEIPEINGNVYDTGIKAYGNYGVEMIFNTSFENDNLYKAFFGTHDNSTSYTTNRENYSSNSAYHFIINSKYSIRVRYYRGYGNDEELNPTISDAEKANNLFWVSFKNGAFKFGTGGKIGDNEKVQIEYSLKTFEGGNFWINGHNQGYTSPKIPIREWLGGRFGLDIPKTKFHYLKIFITNNEYYTFNFIKCNRSELYKINGNENNIAEPVKIIRTHYKRDNPNQNYEIKDTENIYPFTRIEPNS